MEHQELYIVYKCDTWHQRSSYEVIGVCTDKENAISVCIEYAEREGETIPEDELQFLSERLQTQDYSGEGEFIMECHPANTLV